MISVVVCTHNRSARLAVALQRLVSDSHPDDGAEVIVVDNASTDDTSKVVKHFTDNYGFVKSIQEPNLGLSYARNSGLKAAKGGIIAFTDDDAMVQKGWLKAVVRTMRDGRYSGGGGRIVPKWPKYVPKWFIREGPYKMHGGGSIVSLDLGDESRVFREDDLLPMGANMWYRKEVFDAGICFDAERGMTGRCLDYGDDFDVARQTMRRVGPLIYEPAAIVIHPVYTERLSMRYFRRAYYALGRFYGVYDEMQGVREALVDLLKHGLNFLRWIPSNPAICFFHELEICFALGKATERISRHISIG